LNPRTKRPEDLMRVELLYALKIKYEVTEEEKERYKGNIRPISCNEGGGGGEGPQKYSSTLSSTSAIDGVDGEGFTPGKET
jgi:hypothetical protein